MNLDWFAGFADGEGSFVITVIRQKKTGYVNISPQLKIAIVRSGMGTLYAIQRLLAEYGLRCSVKVIEIHKSWSKNAKSQCVLLMGSRKQCLELHNLLQNRIMLRKAEFLLWAQIIKDLDQKKHFTYAGFLDVMMQIDKLHSMRSSRGLLKYSRAYFQQNPPSQFSV